MKRYWLHCIARFVLTCACTQKIFYTLHLCIQVTHNVDSICVSIQNLNGHIGSVLTGPWVIFPHYVDQSKCEIVKFKLSVSSHNFIPLHSPWSSSSNPGQQYWCVTRSYPHLRTVFIHVPHLKNNCKLYTIIENHF